MDKEILEFDLDKFNKQKQLWKESNVKDYKFVYQLLYHYKDEITVKDGKNVKHESNATIDSIYEDIENTFHKSNKKTHSPNDFILWGINVEYDEINHIPIKQDNYYYSDDDGYSENVYTYLIKDFEKITLKPS